jgi:fructose transport system ATP-binding protein
MTQNANGSTLAAVADPRDAPSSADQSESARNAPGTPRADSPDDTTTGAAMRTTSGPSPTSTPVLEARGLVKTWGHVIGLAGVDLRLDAGEVLGIIGDNGAGKSTLIKCLSGALQPDRGEILLEGQPVTFKSPLDSRHAGIETVYQTLAVSPALDIASNMFLGREERMAGVLGMVFRKLDKRGMRNHAKEQMSKLGITTLQDMGQTVETLSGGQRQAVAVARAAAFGSKVIILDEPTAALGVRESNQVLDMIRELRRHGLPVILISHNMPHVFDVADRVHIQRLGRCAGVVSPATTTPEEAVAVMTGAKQLASPAA